jgi:hypothetical protein
MTPILLLLVCFKNRVSCFGLASPNSDPPTSTCWVAGIAGVFRHTCFPKLLLLKEIWKRGQRHAGEASTDQVCVQHQAPVGTLISFLTPASPITLQSGDWFHFI